MLLIESCLTRRLTEGSAITDLWLSCKLCICALESCLCLLIIEFRCSSDLGLAIYRDDIGLLSLL